MADRRLIEIAHLAFTSQAPELVWDTDHENYITDLIAGTLSLEEYDWYEECAEAHRSFATAVFGGLMALYGSGKINDAGYLLGEAHLVTYISNNDTELCNIYMESIEKN